MRRLSDTQGIERDHIDHQIPAFLSASLITVIYIHTSMYLFPDVIHHNNIHTEGNPHLRFHWPVAFCHSLKPLLLPKGYLCPMDTIHMINVLFFQNICPINDDHEHVNIPHTWHSFYTTDI